MWSGKITCCQDHANLVKCKNYMPHIAMKYVKVNYHWKQGDRRFVPQYTMHEKPQKSIVKKRHWKRDVAQVNKINQWLSIVLAKFSDKLLTNALIWLHFSKEFVKGTSLLIMSNMKFFWSMWLNTWTSHLRYLGIIL